MNHPLPGLHRTVSAHVSVARIMTRAKCKAPLDYFEAEKRNADALIGPLIRARASIMLLQDVAQDVKAAAAILANQQERKPHMVRFFCAMAVDAQHASKASRDAMRDELTMLYDELQKALEQSTLDLAEALDDAREVLIKAAAAKGLNLQSLLTGNGAALDLLTGTPLAKALPMSFTRDWQPLTQEQEQAVFSKTLTAYQRTLEGRAILAEESSAHELRAAQKRTKQLTINALADLAMEATK